MGGIGWPEISLPFPFFNGILVGVIAHYFWTSTRLTSPVPVPTDSCRCENPCKCKVSEMSWARKCDLFFVVPSQTFGGLQVATEEFQARGSKRRGENCRCNPCRCNPCKCTAGEANCACAPSSGLTTRETNETPFSGACHCKSSETETQSDQECFDEMDDVAMANLAEADKMLQRNTKFKDKRWFW